MSSDDCSKTMTTRQKIYLVLGVLNVGLGTAGIFLPLLPTTPFLLLAAFLFARSSPRWHGWLLNHPRLGPYIHAFRGKRGLTRSQKMRIIASITVVMWVSAYFAPVVWVRAMLLVMWAFWTGLVLRMRTAPAESPRTLPRGDAAPLESPGYVDVPGSGTDRAASSVPVDSADAP